MEKHSKKRAQRRRDILDGPPYSAEAIAEAKEHGIDLTDPRVVAEMQRLKNDPEFRGVRGGDMEDIDEDEPEDFGMPGARRGAYSPEEMQPPYSEEVGVVDSRASGCIEREPPPRCREIPRAPAGSLAWAHIGARPPMAGSLQVRRKAQEFGIDLDDPQVQKELLAAATRHQDGTPMAAPDIPAWRRWLSVLFDKRRSWNVQTVLYALIVLHMCYRTYRIFSTPLVERNEDEWEAQRQRGILGWRRGGDTEVGWADSEF